MEFLISFGVFVASLAVIEAGYYGYRVVTDPERKKIRQRLRMISWSGEDVDVDLFLKKTLSEVPWLHQMLAKFRWTFSLSRLLEQADVKYPLGVFVLLSLVLAGAGIIGGQLFGMRFLTSLLLGFLFGAAPFSFIYMKKNKRMQKFQRQLPEAMDLMARALKAGHAFSGGLRMVADEMDEPICIEFDKLLAEINFGVAVPEALKNLSQRVDCPDLKFFVIAVVIQRETGGNLAEILENIAYLIRERFKLLGRIRVLAAEGKFSCYILLAVPFLIVLILSVLNAEYINLLFTDPIGHIMVAGALGMMGLGTVVMKKMIHIKV